MVKNTRTKVRSHPLYPLNAPHRVNVELMSKNTPGYLYLGGKWIRVCEIIDRWRIYDEWWRVESIEREYILLLLEEGKIVTVYCNLINGEWWRQQNA